MCISKKPAISQLKNPFIGAFSISGLDSMNGDAPMILEFFKADAGHPTCVGELLLGTRFYYFPWKQLNQVKAALDNGQTIRIKGQQDENGEISKVAWKAV